jgi:hypothetical protein
MGAMTKRKITPHPWFNANQTLAVIVTVQLSSGRIHEGQ